MCVISSQYTTISSTPVKPSDAQNVPKFKSLIVENKNENENNKKETLDIKEGLKYSNLDANNVSFSDNPKIENSNARPDTLQAINKIPKSQLSSAWVGNIASNKNPDGNNEVAILTPKGFDPSKPVKVVYYFHGHLNQKNGIASSVNDLMDNGKSSILEYAKKNNAIIVMPQGPIKDGDGKSSWMQGKNSFEDFNKDILSKVPNLKSKDISIEISGHSAGGIAVRNCVESISGKNSFTNPNGGNMKITKVNFLDASYNSGESSTTSDRADRTFNAINNLNKGSADKIHFNIVVTTNGDRNYHINGKEVNSKNPPPDDSNVTLNYKAGKANHPDVPKMFFSEKL